MGEDDDNDTSGNSGEDSDDSEDLQSDKESEDSEEEDSTTLESDDDEEDEDGDESKAKDDDEDDESLDEKVGAEFAGRPTYRDLKEYDPKLFKKFPELRNVFFREREFTKLYPTVEDAQEAYTELTRLKAGEQRISAADPEDFLEILKDYDQNKERQFIQNFLPALHRRNKTAFMAITEPVLKNALKSMYMDAKRNRNEALENSALNAHEWLFGNDKIEESSPRPQQNNEPDPEKEELKRRNQQILIERQQEFTSNVLDISSKKIRNRIIKDIPEDTSDFLKNSITKEVMDELAKVLRADPAHRSNMERMLRKASQENYSVESRDRIVTAYLSRAIVGLPSILKKVKTEALKGAKPRVEAPRRANGSDARTTRKDSRINPDKAKDVKSGKISALEFLNS